MIHKRLHVFWNTLKLNIRVFSVFRFFLFVILITVSVYAYIYNHVKQRDPHPDDRVRSLLSIFPLVYFVGRTRSAIHVWDGIVGPGIPPGCTRNSRYEKAGKKDGRGVKGSYRGGRSQSDRDDALTTDILYVCRLPLFGLGRSVMNGPDKFSTPSFFPRQKKSRGPRSVCPGWFLRSTVRRRREIVTFIFYIACRKEWVRVYDIRA